MPNLWDLRYQSGLDVPDYYNPQVQSGPAVYSSSSNKVTYPTQSIGRITPTAASTGSTSYSPSGPAGGGGGGGVPTTSDGAPQDNSLDLIEQEYQAFLGQLSSQESNLRAQGDASRSQIGADYGAARTGIEEGQANTLSELASERSGAQTREKGALQQARDLYRQLQQQNIAQLSATGLSSSSVAEALAENLGVETARRIAQTSQTANDIYANIDREKSNVQKFASAKLADLESSKAAQLSQLQSQLVAGLNQINDARNIAAANKAQLRQEVILQAQQAAQQIALQAQKYQQTVNKYVQDALAKYQAAQQIDYQSLHENAQNAIRVQQNLGFNQASYTQDINPFGGKVSFTNKLEEDPNSPFRF